MKMNEQINSAIHYIRELCQFGKDVYLGDEFCLTQHIIASAKLAQKEGYDNEFILSAFFHDFGNLMINENELENMAGFGILGHEFIGADFLRRVGFSDKIATLVENHVKAKRYLTFKDPQYYKHLPISSKHALAFQGGSMTLEEAGEFENDELFDLHIQLRQLVDDTINVIGDDIDCKEFLELAEQHLCDRLKNNFDVPNDIASKIINLKNRVAKNEKPIAVFDLDDTLLDGDIGEAAIAFLKANGEFKDFSYTNYLDDIKNGNTEKAYYEMAQSMNGLTIANLTQATNSVLNKKGKIIEFTDNGSTYYAYPPIANQTFLNLVNFLLSQSFIISIISASPDIVVKISTQRFFGIAPEYSIGVRNKIDNGIITAELIPPIAIGKGKAEVYKTLFGEQLPIIAGGDSINDLSLLNLTQSDGIIYIKNHDQRKHNLIESRLKEYNNLIKF